MTLFLLADLVSSYLNFVFALLLLWNPRGARAAFPFWLRAAVALVLAVGLAKLGKAIPIWPGHPGFPSGHTTFAATSSLLLVLSRGYRWLLPTALMTLAMIVSLIYGRWHSPGDCLGALVLSTLVVLLVGRFMPAP